MRRVIQCPHPCNLEVGGTWNERGTSCCGNRCITFGEALIRLTNPAQRCHSPRWRRRRQRQRSPSEIVSLICVFSPPSARDRSGEHLPRGDIWRHPARAETLPAPRGGEFGLLPNRTPLYPASATPAGGGIGTRPATRASQPFVGRGAYWSSCGSSLCSSALRSPEDACVADPGVASQARDGSGGLTFRESLPDER